jgi:hypothetical protein
MTRLVCPRCKKGDNIYDCSLMPVSYGPMRFTGDGDPDVGSYDHYTDHVDGIEFQCYSCFDCGEEFDRPAPQEVQCPDTSST